MDKRFLDHFILKVGDCVQVKEFPVPGDEDKKPWFQRKESRVPYNHFRESPVTPGFYVVTDFWMHPKANDPQDPNSYCYTFYRVKPDHEPNPNAPWFSKQWSRRSRLTAKDLTKDKVNYNCLHWDGLIKEGVVDSPRYKVTPPEPEFNFDEFRADLGRVLYKHKATLVLGKEYDGPWDMEGTGALKVLFKKGGQTREVSLGWEFPRRKSQKLP